MDSIVDLLDTLRSERNLWKETALLYKQIADDAVGRMRYGMSESKLVSMAGQAEAMKSMAESAESHAS